MALALEQLQANRDLLDAAIGTGEMSVTYADRTVTYRSISELKRARDIIDSDISRLAGRSRQSVAVASKGLS